MIQCNRKMYRKLYMYNIPNYYKYLIERIIGLHAISRYKDHYSF